MTAALVHEYEPRGAAAELLERREREVLLAGPAGTGKTRAALEKLALLMLYNPGSRGLIVRKYLKSLGGTTLNTWRERVIPELLATKGVTYYGGSAEEPPQYRFSNGSTVLIGGLDTVGDQPPKIMSAEYDVVFVDEATELKEGDWQALITRLRNWNISFQQLIGCCNPDAPTHWLQRRCESGRAVMLHSKHQDNPRLYDADGNLVDEQAAAYMATLDALTGVKRLRLRDGIWAAAEGLIYDTFDPSVHVVPRFPIPQDWPRIWGVDFGHTNPMVVQCWARDPDGRLFLYREWYETKRLVEDMAREILAVVAPDGEWIEPRPIAIICDHDAGDRATLEKHLGMGTVAADKSVSTGIQTVTTRLKLDGTGKPRVAFFDDALVKRDMALWDAKKPTCTIEEFASYIWAIKPGGELKEEPRKEHDHGMDTTRYISQYEDRYARPGRVFFPGEGWQ